MTQPDETGTQPVDWPSDVASDPAATTPASSTTTDAPPPLKPGYRTTEFYATVIMSIIALLVGIGVVGPNFAKVHEDVVNAIAVLASVLGPSIYSIARAIAKHGHQKAVATTIAAKVAAAANVAAAPVYNVTYSGGNLAGWPGSPAGTSGNVAQSGATGG